MTASRLIVAGACSALVPLVSMSGSLTPPVVAAPFVALEAPARSGDTPADTTRAAAAPPVASTRLERRSAEAGFKAAVEGIMAGTPGPAWLAWSVPVVERGRDHGWQPRRDADCVLDDDGRLGHGASTDGDATSLVILARFTARAVDRVTFTDARCVVQAGARPVYWLDDVRPGDSVAVLADIVGRTDGDGHHVRQAALGALALTDDPSADTALERFVAPDRPTDLRRDAAFWLGAARGSAGARVVDRLATTDRDDGFREHLTFVLTLTGESGLDRLIDLARHDAAARVRRQALFWLGQKAGERAIGTLSSAVDDDPDIDVRKHAVFAISQLPKDDGIPKLIALAETHRDREVRKQAMFWLGQSGDPRALALFEQVLKP